MRSDPLFVVGAQRSGTTALSLLLAKHNKVFLTVHGKLLYYLILWIHHDYSKVTQYHLRLDEIVHSLKRRPILGIDSNQVDNLLDKLSNKFNIHDFDSISREEVISHIWTGVYEEICGNAEIVGDKYNEYLLQLNEIIHIFPSARFVFIHRNYKDVSESMVRHFTGRPFSPKTYEEAVIKWAQWNKNWLMFSKKIEPGQKYEVSYVDFVTRPKEMFSNICDFLRIPFDKEYSALVSESVKTGRINFGQNIAINFDEVLKIVPDFWQIADELGYSK